MSYEEDREVVYENAFRYRDNLYDTKATLEVSLSTSTQDYKRFSPLKTNISVLPPDNMRRYCFLSYPELYELVESLKEVTTKDSIQEIYNYSSPLKIDRRLSDILLRFTFRKSRNGEKCVIVGIMRNRSDYAYTILPLNFFKAFINKLEYIVQNDSYMQNMLGQRILEKHKVDNISQITQLLKSMPVNISELLESEKPTDTTKSNRDSYEPSVDLPDHNPESGSVDDPGESMVDIFDSYINQNLDNFTLDGDSTQNNQDNGNNITPVESDVFNKVLNQDISNIEPLVNRVLLSNSKLESFSDTIQEETSINPLKSYFSNKDVKSGCYISEFLLQALNKDYIINGNYYPSSVTILKASPEGSDNHIYDIACDLMIVHAYLKNFRTMVENRTSDPVQCKSDLHINFRLLSDFITLSFIENSDRSKIKKNLLSRFRYFNSQGYFDSFNNILNDFNYNAISEKDMKEYIDLVIDKVPTMMGVNSFHKKCYDEGTVKLPPDTGFNLKKITGEIVKLDVIKYMGYDFDEQSLKKFGIDVDEIGDDVFNLFVHGKTKSEPKTNILKFIDSFGSEIPDEEKEPFREYIYELGKNDFDFHNTEFNLGKFGENIVKALYLWNKSNKIERFNDFYSSCRDSLMTKEELLGPIEEDEENEWEDIA